jgi:ABC-type Fe3+-citrate transport system substrate-binding protein
MKFDCDEFTKFVNKLGNLDLIPEDVQKTMLQKGAQVVKESYRYHIMADGLVDTGSMLDHVGYRTPKKISDGMSVYVSSLGKDETGTRNAEKLFLATYGTSKQVAKGTVTKAEKDAEKPAVDAMESAWNAYLLLKEKEL